MKLLPRILLIGGLLLLLAVPVMMLQGLVHVRQQRGMEVAAEIAASGSRAQHLIGPLLRLEIERDERRVRMFQQGGQARTEEETVRVKEVRLVTPARLRVDGGLQT